MTEIKIKEKKIHLRTLPAFKAGEVVRIVDSEKNTTLVYTIKKLKKSHDGTILYLLETTSSPIKILFYQSKKSHLEIVN
jgi:hypothetical protein